MTGGSVCGHALFMVVGLFLDCGGEGLCVIVRTCRCLLHLMTFEFMRTYMYII